jgi:geranylgeranyl pyrophosphate synthase
MMLFMTTDSNIVENCMSVLRKRGSDAFERARAEVLGLAVDGGRVSSALRYFAKVTLRGVLPVFPALMSVSCEAVGGAPEKTVGIGVGLALFAEAADVHDDIIDKSKEKYSKKTVYGKFGVEVALLAGDALLIHGANLLHKESEALPENQRQRILNLTNKSFFEISKAEAKEVGLRGKLDFSSRAYFEIFKLKASVPRLHCEIGAILGNGDEAAILRLGKFGETFGVLTLMTEEFYDVFDLKELENRLTNECPPLPFTYAAKNPTIKSEILQLLRDKNFSERQLKKAAEIVLVSPEVQNLVKKLKQGTLLQVKQLSCVNNEKVREELATLLLAPLNSLQCSLQRTSR